MIHENGEILFFRSLTSTEILLIIVILVSSLLIMKLNRHWIPFLANKFSGKRRLYILALMPILRLLIVVGAFIIIFPILIVPTTENLIAFLGAMGIALGFALKEYISSLIAGIVTLYEMPYRPGDWIEINGIYGEVISIGLRSIELRTPDDTVVHIPQLKIWDTPVFNSTGGSRDMLCVTNFYLNPNHEAALIKQKLYDVAITSPFLQLKKPIEITVKEKPWGTHYQLKAYPIDARDQFRFVSDLTIRGKKALLDLDVKFAIVTQATNSE
ncbi:MAG: mechanosensitive ion channel family protein [Candidatus Hodarchaeota archaeon]